MAGSVAIVGGTPYVRGKDTALPANLEKRSGDG
jgi:hypothetical protein